MRKIEIEFKDGSVIVTTEDKLNGYILKGVRTQNEIVRYTLI
jgi:hypothetical protein